MLSEASVYNSGVFLVVPVVLSHSRGFLQYIGILELSSPGFGLRELGIDGPGGNRIRIM